MGCISVQWFSLKEIKIGPRSKSKLLSRPQPAGPGLVFQTTHALCRHQKHAPCFPSCALFVTLPSSTQLSSHSRPSLGISTRKLSSVNILNIHFHFSIICFPFCVLFLFTIYSCFARSQVFQAGHSIAWLHPSLTVSLLISTIGNITEDTVK